MLTNADGLTPEQRRKAEADDFNNQVIKDAVARSEREGPKIEAVASDQNIYTTHARLAEKQSARVGNRGSIIPIAVRVGPEYPGGFHWVLSDADMDLIEHGMACPYCLVFYPQMWAPACTACGIDREIL